MRPLTGSCRDCADTPSISNQLSSTALLSLSIIRGTCCSGESPWCSEHSITSFPHRCFTLPRITALPACCCSLPSTPPPAQVRDAEVHEQRPALRRCRERAGAGRSPGAAGSAGQAQQGHGAAGLQRRDRRAGVAGSHAGCRRRPDVAARLCGERQPGDAGHGRADGRQHPKPVLPRRVDSTTNSAAHRYCQWTGNPAAAVCEAVRIRHRCSRWRWRCWGCSCCTWGYWRTRRRFCRWREYRQRDRRFWRRNDGKIRRHSLHRRYWWCCNRCSCSWCWRRATQYSCWGICCRRSRQRQRQWRRHSECHDERRRCVILPEPVPGHHWGPDRRHRGHRGGVPVSPAHSPHTYVLSLAMLRLLGCFPCCSAR